MSGLRKSGLNGRIAKNYFYSRTTAALLRTEFVAVCALYFRDTDYAGFFLCSPATACAWFTTATSDTPPMQLPARVGSM